MHLGATADPTDTQLTEWLTATFGAPVNPWTAFQALFLQVVGRPIDPAEAPWFQARIPTAVAPENVQAVLDQITAFLQLYRNTADRLISVFSSFVGRPPTYAEGITWVVPLLDRLAAGSIPTDDEIRAGAAPMKAEFADQRTQGTLGRIAVLFRSLYGREITAEQNARVRVVLFTYFMG